MKVLWESCVIAISMYSKIPMPRVEWNEKNMKYSMCFFPFVGVVISILMNVLGTFLWNRGVGRLFFAIFMTLLPLLITGGIHMDGFIDTVDAVRSYGDREKKLEILKDPHVGAFAIIGVAMYLLWSVAIWSEASVEMLPLIGCGYVLSRALSGMSVVTFPAARNSGLLHTFQDGAKGRTVRITMICFLLGSAVLSVLWGNVIGWLQLGIAGLSFCYYSWLCRKQFGGVTGDLAGYFLQLCELAMVTGIVLFGNII